MLNNFRLTLLAAASTAAMAAGAHAANFDIYGGGSTLGAPTYELEYGGSAKNYCNTPLCPPYQFHYAAVGSGAGTTAFLSNVNTGDTPLVPPAGKNPAFGNVDFGASDAALVTSQVSSFVRVPSTATYPMIQVPAMGIAITIPYSFKGLPAPAVTLRDNDLCGIFSGKITNWNQTSANPGNQAITVVYRSDGSGTSFTLLTHLATPGVCTTGTGGNSNITFTATTTFASLFGGTPPSNFIGESGSGGVRTELLSLQTAGSGAVGYVGPDYTSVVATNQPNYSTLPVASLVNRNNSTAYQPWNSITSQLNGRGGKDTITPALATVAPPTPANASNPVNWGILVPNPSTGYPIVGYTYLQFSQCYASTNTGKGILAWMGDNYNNAGFGTIIQNSGFVTVPATAGANYVSAITEAFITNASPYNLNLNIDNATICKSGVGR
jgi:ABC-type phosphate transport system substrate-binding protein